MRQGASRMDGQPLITKFDNISQANKSMYSKEMFQPSGRRVMVSKGSPNYKKLIESPNKKTITWKAILSH